jgi:uncharacterized RDD family membrane protein YckC
MWEYTIKINTPENTQIEFELAGIGNRFAALITDYFVILLLTAFMYICMFIFLILFDEIAEQMNHYFLAIILAAIFVINFNGYFILFESLWSGQTPGKRMVGIRVIRDNGQPVGFIEVFVRNVLRIIDILLGPYFVLFSTTEKRLGDFAVGTIVVREKEVSVPIVDTVIPENFDVEIPNISSLTPKEFTLIGSFLKRKDDFEFNASVNLLNEFLTLLFDKLSIRTVYNIASIDDLTYDEKLKWLLNIYNAYKLRGNINASDGGTD